MRDALREAITILNAADDRAATAKDIADRADAMMIAARERCERLKAEQKAAANLATEERAANIMMALRGGFEPPLPQIEVSRADSAELAAATQNYRALEVASNELAADHNKAAETAAAAEDVRVKAAAIVEPLACASRMS